MPLGSFAVPESIASAFDWRAALAEHEHWLRLVVLARLGEPQAVPDVMQEVALAAGRGARTLRDTDKAPAWLYRLAVNAALQHRRKAARRRRRVGDYRERRAARHAGEPATQADPLDRLVALENRQLVRKALASLPRRDAELLLLKYTQDWTYAKLADRLAVSEAALVGRLQRARARLRSALRKEDPSLGPPAATQRNHHRHQKTA